MNKQRLLRWTLFLNGLLFVAVQAYAVDLSDTFSIHGFGTAGLTKTNNADMGYRTTLSSDSVVYDDWDLASRSLVGAQINARWNDKWSSTLQLVQQQQAARDFGDAIQLATLSYSPTPEWSIRVGRDSPRIHMLTDTRNVGYGYLWTHPPVEFYGQVQTTYIDGVEVSYTKQFGSDMLRTTVAVGKATLPMSYPGYDFQADFGKTAGLTLEYEHDAWQFRGTVAKIVNTNQWASSLRQYLDSYAVAGLSGAAELSDQLNTANSALWFYTVGAAYENSNWVIQSELSQLTSGNDIAPDSISGYLSIGRHIGPVTPYVMYSRINTYSHDNKTPADVAYYSQYDTQLAYLSNASQQFINSQFDQSGIAIGIRWNINSKLALKTQWDRKYINPNGNHLWWNIDDSTKKTVDIFTLNLDFVF